MLQTLVGIGLVVLRDNQIMLSRRLKPLGYGCYSCPGGHINWMESFEDCAKRELKEEAGPDIQIGAIDFIAATNNVFPELNKHYVTIWLVAPWVSGEPIVPEAEKTKHEQWGWYDLNNLPSPTFELSEDVLTKIKRFATSCHT